MTQKLEAERLVCPLFVAVTEHSRKQLKEGRVDGFSHACLVHCCGPVARQNTMVEDWLAQRCLHHGSQDTEGCGGGNLEEDTGPKDSFPVTQSGPMLQLLPPAKEYIRL